jgi:hypothetical protein
MVSARAWLGTGPDGSQVIYTYVETEIGNYAYRQRGNIVDMRNAIPPGLSDEDVEALFADH